MSRFTRSTRMVVASALFVSTAVVFAASPANAAPTGSLANDGNGGLVVTYSSPTAQDSIDLEIRTSGSNCNVQQPPLAVLSNDSLAPQLAQIGASPATIAVGTTAYGLQPAGSLFTVAAASYTFCLFDTAQPLSPLAQLTMTIGQASPTTTTTTTASPTTTTAAGTPVAPAFTG
jgi:hypothetical protein